MSQNESQSTNPNSTSSNSSSVNQPTVEAVFNQQQQQINALMATLQQMQFTNQSSENTKLKSLLAPPKAEIFDGKSVESFIYSLDNIYSYANVTSDEQKIKTAIRYFRGAALRWYQSQVQNKSECLESWNQFIQSLKAHFQSSNTIEIARAKLKALTQRTTVMKYNELFNHLIMDIVNMDEDTKVSEYLKGLKETVRLQVALSTPTSVNAAQTKALVVDAIINSTSYLTNSRFSNQSSKNNSNRQNNNRSKHNSSNEMDLSNLEDQDDVFESTNELSAVTNARSSYKGNNKLSVEEQKRLMKEGRCFRCKGLGHLSRDCPKQNQTSSINNQSKNE